MQKVVGVLAFILGVVITVVGIGLFASTLNGGGLAGIRGPMVILSGVVIFAGIALCVAGIQKYRQAHREKNAPAFMNFRGDDARLIEVDGDDVIVHYLAPVQGKGGRPSNLNILITSEAPSEIRMTLESGFDRFAKRLGVAVEHQTEDSHFDNEVYVRAPSSQFAAEYLADASHRDSVRRLLQMRFTEVYIEHDAVGVNWKGFNPLDKHPENLAHECARELRILAADIPATEIDSAELERGWTAVHSAVMSLLILMAIGTGVFCYYHPPVRVWSIIGLGTYVAFAAVPVMAVVTSLLCRGSSTAHDQWIHFLTWGILLTIAISYFGLQTGNVYFDQSKPVVHVSKVLNKQEKRRQRGTSRCVTVQAWDRPNETIEIIVSSSDYRAVQVGVSSYEVVTSGGAIGVEWIRSQRLMP